MSWASEEMTTIKTGDKRLDKRVVSLLEKFGDNPTGSIPSACSGWAEVQGAYRCFDNEKITAEKILGPHQEATKKRMSATETVLLVQDTTELDYHTHKAKKGIGALNYENRKGLLLHSMIAVTPEGLNLGVVNAHYWHRKEIGKAADSVNKPIEEKESYRWLQGYELANEIAQEEPETKIVVVCDREADIHELLTTANCQDGRARAEWLIRSARNRCIETNRADEPKKLHDAVRSVPALGTLTFEFKDRESKKVRRVEQAIHVKKVRALPPRNRGQRVHEEAAEIYVIAAIEQSPPKGEKPIDRILLTSIPVETLEEAQEKINWYISRWEVEVFFRILKSGCQVEELQLTSAARLIPCLALYSIVAWRVQYLTMLGRGCPDMSCDIFFSELEWKSVYTVVKREEPPATPPSLDTMIRHVAGLGGFLGRKGDGFPGPKTIWIGLQKARHYAEAWEVFHAVNLS